MVRKTNVAVNNFLDRLRRSRQSLAGLLAQGQMLLEQESNKIDQAQEKALIRPPITDDECTAERKELLLTMRQMHETMAAHHRELAEEHGRLIAQLQEQVLRYSEQIQRCDLAIEALERDGAYGFAEAQKLLDDSEPLPKLAVLTQ